jgi:hypothetical protein
MSGGTKGDGVSNKGTTPHPSDFNDPVPSTGGPGSGSGDSVPPAEDSDSGDGTSNSGNRE